MLNKKQKWTVAFFGLIALAGGMELLAVFDTSNDTIPLTTYIVDYVPEWITFPVIIALFVWLMYHFYPRYKEKDLKNRGSS